MSLKKSIETIDQTWIKKLGLSDELFYKTRYPQGSMFQHYEKIEGDSFYRDIAQFAPYIVKDGKTQPILMIKINRELVYYHDVDDQPPYSFIGPAGKNNITVRTLDHQFNINGIELKAGHKLELSIAEDQIDKKQKGAHLSKKSMPDTWTTGEINLIKNSILVLKNHHKYWSDRTAISQGKQRIHFINTKANYAKLGPFRNQTIRFYPKPKKGSSTKRNQPFNFRFEPGFSYEINPTRDRLYEYHFSKKISYKNRRLFFPLELVYTPEDLRQFNWQAITTGSKSNIPLIGKSTAVFKIKNPEKVRLTILENADSFHLFLPGFTPKFRDLLNGEYQLSVLYFDGSYLNHNFTITEKAVVFQNLSNAVI